MPCHQWAYLSYNANICANWTLVQQVACMLQILSYPSLFKLLKFSGAKNFPSPEMMRGGTEPPRDFRPVGLNGPGRSPGLFQAHLRGTQGIIDHLSNTHPSTTLCTAIPFCAPQGFQPNAVCAECVLGIIHDGHGWVKRESKDGRPNSIGESLVTNGCIFFASLSSDLTIGLDHRPQV